jgi:hypothetical protein
MDLGTRAKISNRISFEILSVREVNLNTAERIIFNCISERQVRNC